MWTLLRRRRLGWKFRRQHVIAGYIVDFYCSVLRLVVEVDGSVHDTRDLEDRQRDAALASLGVRTLRVPNADILERPTFVLNALTLHCTHLATNTLSPSPVRGGGTHVPHGNRGVGVAGDGGGG